MPRNERARSQQQLEQAIRKRVATIPGVDLKVGWNTPIYVALLGNNDAEMNRVIADLKGKVQQIRGVTDVEISVKEGTPALSVRLKPELAAEYGITHAQLGTTLRAMVGGENSGYWLAPDGQNYEVITQLPQANRTIVDDIAQSQHRDRPATGGRRAGSRFRCDPIATLERTFNPENIRRQDLQRRVAMFANVQGRPAGDAGQDVQELVKTYVLPPGLRFDVGGQIREQQEINAAIVGALLLAVIFIYMVLASQFGSFFQPVAIMASLPLSMVGVMLALLVTGTTLNIFSMIGIVFLMGLVTKNAILLVDFANRGSARDSSAACGAACGRTGPPAADPDDHRRDDLRHAAAGAGAGRGRRAAGADGPRHHRRRDHLDAADAGRRAGDLYLHRRLRAPIEEPAQGGGGPRAPARGQGVTSSKVELRPRL